MRQVENLWIQKMHIFISFITFCTFGMLTLFKRHSDERIYLILKNETLWKDISLDGRKTNGNWTKLQKFRLVVSDNFIGVIVDWHLVDFKINWYKPNGTGVSKAKRILFSTSSQSHLLRIKYRFWHFNHQKCFVLTN